jgi:hypothetical protein
MTPITIEKLDAVLKHKNIEIIPNPNPEKYFDRNRFFKINGQNFKIVWFCNTSTLFFGDVLVRFVSVSQEKTWPNRAKMNLQFYDEHGDVCCVIKIEDYPEDK